MVFPKGLARSAVGPGVSRVWNHGCRWAKLRPTPGQLHTGDGDKCISEYTRHDPFNTNVHNL